MHDAMVGGCKGDWLPAGRAVAVPFSAASASGAWVVAQTDNGERLGGGLFVAVGLAVAPGSARTSIEKRTVAKLAEVAFGARH